MKNKIIMIRMPEVLRQWVEEMAAADDRTMSAACRHILETERRRRLAAKQQQEPVSHAKTT